MNTHFDMTTIAESREMYGDDHQSLDASLQDFEARSASEYAGQRNLSLRLNAMHNFPQRFKPTLGGGGLFPSSHSEFRSDHLGSDSEEDVRPESSGGYSPPAYRRTRDGGRSTDFWNPHDNVLKRESSPAWHSGDEFDATLAAATRTRLPTGSISPEKRRSPSPEKTNRGRASSPIKRENASSSVSPGNVPENSNNCKFPTKGCVHPLSRYRLLTMFLDMRFSVRAEVQHRTEPVERALVAVTRKFESMTKSWTNIILSVAVLILSAISMRVIFTPPLPTPVPDLVKVAGLAKAFEPLLFYSENGQHQISDLRQTAVAVWDLSESVRQANMTSAPILVGELDGLSENLNTLSVEFASFFADVNGHVDSFLLAIDWAKRELSHLPQGPHGAMTKSFAFTHGLLSRAKLLENSKGQPTAIGSTFTSLFGATPTQVENAQLSRTFHELLETLEEAANAELAHSIPLFALFEAIDRQYNNIQRVAVRESDTQERLETELLSSIWARVLGANSKSLRKYEENKKLLLNVRETTLHRKRALADHKGQLMSLKANIETLRKRLVSPLVRGEGGKASLSLAEQIRGLEGTEKYLSAAMERQRRSLMEALYAARTNKGWQIVSGDERNERYEIDASRERR